MEAFISALGLLISALMDLPGRAVAATEQKKNKIGKELYQIVTALDKVIKQGYEILAKIEQLANTQDELEFKKQIRELSKLLDDQMKLIIDTGEDVAYNYLGGFYWQDPKGIHLGHPTNVSKVLSIYQPDLGNHIAGILSTKSSIIFIFLKLLQENLNQFNTKNLWLKEIEIIDMSKFRIPRYQTLESWEKAEGIRFKTINLLNNKERTSYLTHSRKRLKELETARVELANLIKQYYEPHHIL